MTLKDVGKKRLRTVVRFALLCLVLGGIHMIVHYINVIGGIN